MRTVIKSSRAITEPRSIVVRAATTSRAVVVEASSQTLPSAPNATTSTIAANSPQRRRARGGVGTAAEGAELFVGRMSLAVPRPVRAGEETALVVIV
ncbi:MAG TPA: hypothetical protein VIK43_08030 [Cellulomonas sp.]